MKKIVSLARGRRITRRELLGGVLAAGIVSTAPAFLRGRNLNNKLNIAMIACGGRANSNTKGDGDLGRVGGKGQSSGGPTGIPAENITVLCDVNQDAVEAAAARFPQAKKYNDLRRVFDSPGDFDAVMVSTAEHTHTLATWLALTHGKHVYCEKPLTHDVWEASLIRETAAKHPELATQTGNQGHASPVRRQIQELLKTGAIGPVREAHVWAGRAWGLQDAASAEKYDKPHGFYNGIQITDRFPEEMPVPANIHWDLWIGPAPMRPFHATYLPGPRWYRWWDFGNGTMSDLGGHDNDAVFQVLGIRQPLTIESVSPTGKAHAELAPASMTVTYEFGPHGKQPALKLVWYQGVGRPPQFDPATMGERGLLLVGDAGMLYSDGRGPRLLPEDKFKDFPTPPETLPRSPGHYVEWIQACKGEGPAPGSNFQHSGWVTESNHLGNVAWRTGKKLQWDSVNLRASNAPEADQYLRRPYRKGWDRIIT
ncbi:MAG: Gfo/Idh/MocA family protein [Thermoguttaceae bacterium]